jgi:hypothetical protein
MGRISQAHRQSQFGLDSSGRSVPPGEGFTNIVQSAEIETPDGIAVDVPLGGIPAVVAITGAWAGTETINVSFTGGVLAPATGTVTLDSGGAGSVDGITVDSIQVMSGAVAFATDLEVTASAVAANITAHTSSPDYNAVANGAVVTITSVATGYAVNGFVVVSATTTIVTTDVDMAGAVGGSQTTGAVAITAGNAEEAAAEVATALDALVDTQVVVAGSRIELTPVAPTATFTIDTVVIG